MFSKICSIIQYQIQDTTTMNYFKDLTEDGPVKFVSCLAIGAINWIIGSFIPIFVPLIILALLIITDAILGCKVSVKKGDKIESRKFWKTLKKILQSSAIVWFAHAIDADILLSFDAHLVEASAGLISAIEFLSILENLTTLYPDGPWGMVSKIVKTKTEKYLDITIEKTDLPKVKELVKKIK